MLGLWAINPLRKCWKYRMPLTLMIILTTVLPALLLLAWCSCFIIKARRSITWPLVPATIVGSHVVKQGNTCSPHLAFDYEVSGQKLEGQRLWVGPRSLSVSGNWADRVTSRYPVGAIVKVAVDPADATYSVLEPGMRAFHWLMLAIVQGCVVGGCLLQRSSAKR